MPDDRDAYHVGARTTGGSIEFRLLGAVEAHRDGRPVRLAPGQRVVLTVLLLNAGHTTPVERLSRWLWEDHAPRTAATALHGHVSQLRRRLGLWPVDGAGPGLVTRRSGYLLRPDDARIDLAEFRATLMAARHRRDSGDLSGAAGTYRTAMSLVRGDPLSGLPPRGPVLVQAGQLADEVRTADEERIAVELILGRHAALVADLDRLVARYPHRPALLLHWVDALVRCGRRAEALDALRAGHARLGPDHAERLAEREQALFSRPVAGTAGTPPVRTTIRPTTPPGPSLAGRDAALHRLQAWLADPRAVRPMVTVAGPPGCGKTALALAAADRLAGSYPDGAVLVVAGEPAAGPQPLLRQALHALDDAADPPVDGTTGAVRLRSRLAGRRMLLILDGLRADHTVTALLDGGWAGVLVTANGRVDPAPARTLVLDRLDEDAAIELMRGRVGSDRVGAEPGPARQVARYCDRLPVALRAAAARLVRHPHWTMARLAERLSDPARRLNELRCGDIDVSETFERACNPLPAFTRHALCRLAAAEADGITTQSAAAVLAVSCDDAAAVLAALSDQHLVNGDASGRYEMPELIRCFGRERFRRGVA